MPPTTMRTAAGTGSTATPIPIPGPSATTTRSELVVAPDGPTIELPRTVEPSLAPGTPVEVRRRFDRAWARGFAVAEVSAGTGTDAYRVRRLTDGAVLPVWFPADEVRPAP